MPHEVEGSAEDNADQGEVAQVKDDNVDSIGWDRPRGDVGSLFSLKKFKTNKQNEVLHAPAATKKNVAGLVMLAKWLSVTPLEKLDQSKKIVLKCHRYH